MAECGLACARCAAGGESWSYECEVRCSGVHSVFGKKCASPRHAHGGVHAGEREPCVGRDGKRTVGDIAATEQATGQTSRAESKVKANESEAEVASSGVRVGARLESDVEWSRVVVCSVVRARR
jgi:hypothetical protein